MPTQDPDLLRAALVALLALAQAAAAYGPDVIGARHTITSRSAALDTPVVPWGPFFAIWIVLFLGSAWFAAWHWTARETELARTLGWAVAALFAGNAAWEIAVVRRGLDRTSQALIAVEAALALVILARLRDAAVPSGWGGWAAVTAVELLCGWVVLAVFAAGSSVLLAERRMAATATASRGAVPAAPVSPGTWTAGIALAGVAVATLALWSGSVPAAMAGAWGLAGIGVKAMTEGRRQDLWAAVFGIALTGVALAV